MEVFVKNKEIIIELLQKFNIHRLILMEVKKCEIIVEFWRMEIFL